MIPPTTLARVGEALRADPRASALRQQFPELHFTECSEDDVSPRYKPVLTVDGFDLYLISGATGHCLEFTSDHDAATGVLIAAKVDDE